jgi:hypothetical protein
MPQAFHLTLIIIGICVPGSIKQRKIFSENFAENGYICEISETLYK